MWFSNCRSSTGQPVIFLIFNRRRPESKGKRRQLLLTLTFSRTAGPFAERTVARGSVYSHITLTNLHLTDRHTPRSELLHIYIQYPYTQPHLRLGLSGVQEEYQPKTTTHLNANSELLHFDQVFLFSGLQIIQDTYFRIWIHSDGNFKSLTCFSIDRRFRRLVSETLIRPKIL